MLFQVFTMYADSIISPSNMYQEFVIDNVDGVGIIAISPNFKYKFKSTISYNTNGIVIRQKFWNYIAEITHLNCLEEIKLLELFNKDCVKPSSLMSIEKAIATVKISAMYEVMCL